MNVFRKMNRKQKREFGKLSAEEKADALMNAIQPEISKANVNIASDSFMCGYLFAFDNLYDKYLQDYAYLNDEEREDVCAKIVAEIVENKKKYDARYQKEKQEMETVKGENR